MDPSFWIEHIGECPKRYFHLLRFRAVLLSFSTVLKRDGLIKILCVSNISKATLSSIFPLITKLLSIYSCLLLLHFLSAFVSIGNANVDVICLRFGSLFSWQVSDPLILLCPLRNFQRSVWYETKVKPSIIGHSESLNIWSS